MDQFLAPIVYFVEKLDSRQFYQATGALLLLVGIACGLLVYQSTSINNQYKKQYRMIEKNRAQLQKIIASKQQVEQERRQVELILDQDPYFNLSKYFKEVLNQFGLRYGTITPLSTPNSTYPEYTDIVATGIITEATMQKLTKFLQAVEENARVHIKELEIRQEKPGTVEATVSIATLLKRQEG